MAAQRDKAWVGIDVGKTHHWACVVDTEGKPLLSVKIANDEAEIMALLANTGPLAVQLIWAVDIIGAPSALLLALLARAGQSVRYSSGRVVAAMSAAYAGEGKTDAKDAYVIAETARLRRDLPVIDTDADLIRDLAVLTGHREDLIADRVTDDQSAARPDDQCVSQPGAGFRLLLAQRSVGTAHRLRHTRSDPPYWTDPPDRLVAEPQCARLGRCGLPCHRRSQGTNDCATRPRSDGQHHHRVGWPPASLPSTIA